MKFFITSDSYWEAKVDKVIYQINNTGYRQYFSEQDYGISLEGLIVALICQSPDLNLKQRIRFSKKERKLYLDLMLDLPQFLEISQQEREAIIANKLISEIPPIIARYKLKDFDHVKFEKDLKCWMLKIL